MSGGEPARRWCHLDTAYGVPLTGDSPTSKGGSFDGEGGIRTLEAGISPPNALAGRRLQPLGHFSRAAIVPHPSTAFGASANGEDPRGRGSARGAASAVLRRVLRQVAGAVRRPLEWVNDHFARVKFSAPDSPAGL